MGKPLPFFILGVLLGAASLSGAYSDWQRDSLLGPVRTIVTEKVGSPTSAGPEQDSRRHVAITPARWQAASAQPAQPTIDTEGSSQERVLWSTITYNAQGKRTEAAFYHDNGTLRWKWQYVYDAQGRRRLRTSYDASGMQRWIWEYRYNAEGRLTGQTEQNGDGELTRRWQYVYDAAGHLLEETNYHANGALLWKWRYTYDAAGNCLSKSQYSAHDLPVRHWQYTYDPSGHRLEETILSALGTLMWRYRYVYDDRGNVTDEWRYKADGSLLARQRYHYHYDAKGNWVKRLTAQWNPTADVPVFEPAEITYRTLTYYDALP